MPRRRGRRHQPRFEPLPAPLVEAFPGQDPADAVEGIVLAAPVAEEVALDPAGVVQGPVGQGDHVEGVDHQVGVVEPSLVSQPGR